MSTAKVLEKPAIIEILGSKIRVKHPDLSGSVQTSVAAPIVAAATALSVLDNNNFANGDYLLFGKIGDEKSEECSVGGAVTKGTSLTIANTTVFSHDLDCPVTKIYERGIRIYGASTIGGSGTLITSIDAITTPIADAFNITWDKPYSEYNLLSTDTAFAYYFVKFTDGTTDSVASDYIPAAGLDNTYAATMIRQALDLTNTSLDNSKFTWEGFVQWCQDWQDAISQFSYQDPVSGKGIKKDWNHELVYDQTTITLTQGTTRYDFSTFTNNLKYQDSARALVNIRIGDGKPLDFVETDDFDRLMQDKHMTNTSGSTSSGATTLNVTNASAFDSSGSLTIGTQTLTYTAKTATSFTGIPASGTGSVTSTIAASSEVWQNNAQGSPRRFTIFRNYLYLDVPPDSTNAGRALKVKYFKKLTRITTASSTTEIPFTNTAQFFLGWKIELRKGNTETAQSWKSQFDKDITANAMADSQPVPNTYNYYAYQDFDEQNLMYWVP